MTPPGGASTVNSMSLRGLALSVLWSQGTLSSYLMHQDAQSGFSMRLQASRRLAGKPPTEVCIRWECSRNHPAVPDPIHAYDPVAISCCACRKCSLQRRDALFMSLDRLSGSLVRSEGRGGLVGVPMSSDSGTFVCVGMEEAAAQPLSPAPKNGKKAGKVTGKRKSAVLEVGTARPRSAVVTGPNSIIAAIHWQGRPPFTRRSRSKQALLRAMTISSQPTVAKGLTLVPMRGSRQS